MISNRFNLACFSMTFRLCYLILFGGRGEREVITNLYFSTHGCERGACDSACFGFEDAAALAARALLSKKFAITGEITETRRDEQEKERKILRF